MARSPLKSINAEQGRIDQKQGKSYLKPIGRVLATCFSWGMIGLLLWLALSVSEFYQIEIEDLEGPTKIELNEDGLEGGDSSEKFNRLHIVSKRVSASLLVSRRGADERARVNTSADLHGAHPSYIYLFLGDSSPPL